MASGDPENRINLFRLQILIIDGGLLVLRSILDQTIAAQGLTLKACLNNERAKITRLHGLDVISQAQYDLLFPVGGQDPTTADMDITLITCLLTNLKCFGLNKKFKWNATPVSTDLTVEADICRLRNFRNKICHISTTTGIEQNEFATLWNEIEQILIRRKTPSLNMHQTIADFKSCSLDPEEERRMEEEIKKCKNYEADVDRLKQEMGDVKENFTRVNRILGDVKGNVMKVKEHLDDVKENVTEVRSDLDDVKENADEVKRDLEDVKGNVNRDLDDVKGNIMNVQKDLDDVKENVIKVNSDIDDVKENFTEVKSDFGNVKENATEVKRDLNDVKENVTEVKRDLDGVKENVTDLKIGVIKVEKDLEEVKRRQQTVIYSRKDFLKQTEEETYQTRKKELKDGLIEFYKTRHSKVFLSPLFEENDTPLASFYIRPELNLIITAPTGIDEKRQVKSLSAIFKTENQANREIHVIADAGFGKTAFSNYLAITWCQAHFPDEEMTQYFKKDDIHCMQGFDFLFLVLLRHSNDLCSIDDLIFKKIVSNVGVQEKPSEDFLLKILKNETCLVILDGLDEWTHPEKECHRSPRSIPHRNDRTKCTIVTTTRPWKLGVLNLNSCQKGQKVELTKLSNDSAVTLIERILQRLKLYPNKDALQRDVTAFISGIESRQNDELISVPLLLIYTICLWCDGVEIGNSKCELYINIVELLLSRTIQKHGDLQQLCDLSESVIPECLAKYENCTKYFPLLVCLGKLAYLTLFNETKENTLVFDGSVAEKYLSTDEMKFTLHAGMLSESTSKTLTKKLSKVSFSHKTVQEFFAAIFISSENESQKIVLEKCRNIQDCLDMSKIYEFVSKMNADLVCEVLNNLMSVINEDEETRYYRTGLGYNDILPNIQKMFMSCLQEMPESKNIQLCLQDFFIDENTEHSEQLQRLLKQNKTNIKSLYIHTRYTSNKLPEIIDLFSLTDLSHIQKFHYDGYMEETKIHRTLFPSLQAVALSMGKWTNGEENLSENLARCQNLQELHIELFTLSHKILETFFNFISAQKSIKWLTLDRLDCKEHGGRDCKRWNLDLSRHSTLSHLYLQRFPWRLQLNLSPSLDCVELWDINLDESSLLLSRDMLNIHCVILRELEMSAGSLQNFIIVLKNLPQSVTVEMSAIKPETEYDRVRENIRRSQTFHVIRSGSGWGESFEFKTIKPSQVKQDGDCFEFKTVDNTKQRIDKKNHCTII